MPRRISGPSSAEWQKLHTNDPPLALFTIAEDNTPQGMEPFIKRFVPRVGGVSGAAGVNQRGEVLANVTYDEFVIRGIAPTQDEDLSPRATVELGNVDEDIVRQLYSRRLDDATITMVVVRSSTPDFAEFTQRFRLEEVSVTGTALQFTVSLNGLLRYPASRITYNKEIAPGLFL